MRTQIKAVVISLVAMITFALIGAQLIASVETHGQGNEANDEAMEWAEFHADSFAEHADAFTAYFNSLEYKRAKNGASMIRRPGDKSFRFVAKAK